MPPTFRVVGVDVTSAPKPDKPITLARGLVGEGRLTVVAVDEVVRLDDYAPALARLEPSLVCIDHPFGMPRVFLEDLDWPRDFARAIETARELGAAGFKAQVAAFRDRQPPGQKHPYRQIDGVAGSASPVNVVNPPVGRMWQACAPALLDVGADVRPGNPTRGATITVVEGYASLVAEALVGTRTYKSESPGGDTAERRRARAAILESLSGPACRDAYGVTVSVPANLRLRLLESHRADHLDAVLLAIQAAWAGQRADLGIWPGADPVEGWIADPVCVDGPGESGPDAT